MSYKKSTLSASLIGNTAFSPSSPIYFTNSCKTGCSIGFNVGGTAVQLLNSGLYLVNVTANGTITSGSGDIELGLFVDGVRLPEATTSITTASTSTNVGLTIIKIIEVPQCCNGIKQPKTLSIYTGENGPTFANVNLNIIKIA